MDISADALTNYGTQSIKDVRLRRIYNEEPNLTGLTVESILSTLDIKSGGNFTTSVSGNIIIGATGHYDANLETYWDINAGTSGCIRTLSDFCLDVGTYLDITSGTTMKITTSLLELSGDTTITNSSSNAFIVESVTGSDCFIVDTLSCAVTIAGNLSVSNFAVENIEPVGNTLGISGNLAVTGNVSVCGGIVELDQGTAGAPSLTFCGDLNTGFFSPGADSVALTTAGTQRVTVSSSGNVGIGTASPTQRLDVNGIGRIRSVLQLKDSVDTATDTIFSHQDASVTNSTARYMKFGKALSDNNTGIIEYFHVSDGSTDNVVRMGVFGRHNIIVMRAGGNVGIGTFTPTQKLHVDGDALIQGGDLYLVDTNEKIASDGTDMFFHVGGTEVVRFEAGGNVGIGTNNPSEKLHVAGNALISNTSATAFVVEKGTGEDCFVIDTTTCSATFSGDTTITSSSTGAFIVEGATGNDCLVVDTINCKTTIDGILQVGEIGISGNLTVEGNLTVNGTETILNTEVLEVDDNAIVLNGVSFPNDTGADGGGIILQGTNNYTILWDEQCIQATYGTTAAWTFNQNVSVDDTLGYYIDCKVHHDQENLLVNTRKNNHAGALYLSSNDITAPVNGDWRITTFTSPSGDERIAFERYDGTSWIRRSQIN